MSELPVTSLDSCGDLPIIGGATLATLDVLGYHCDEQDILRGLHEVGDLVPCPKGGHTHRVLKVILHIPIINVVVIEGDQPAST